MQQLFRTARLHNNQPSLCRRTRTKQQSKSIVEISGSGKVQKLAANAAELDAEATINRWRYSPEQHIMQQSDVIAQASVILVNLF